MIDRRHVCLSVALGAFASAGCKDTSSAGRNTPEGEVVTARKPPAGGLFATDPSYIAQDEQFFFLVWNTTFTTTLADLPQSGEVPDAHKPYAGSYYAAEDGGTDQIVAGTQSPLAKYDAAYYNSVSTSVAWERAKHVSTIDWAGHCNGFSAASSRQQTEPSKNVVRNGVTFAPQDVKALLAEVYMSADYQFLGGTRCEEDIIPSPDSRSDPTQRSECEGINPGTLHLAVTNWIGLMQHNIIMDAYPVDQVWNYPLFKYQVVSQTTVTAAQAAQLVDGSSTYKFDPTAASFASVHMTLTYAEALRQEVLGTLYTKTMDLYYILELDSGGNIIGGEWTTESQQYFPGFLWVALPPLPPNGTAYMGNQYVDATTVLAMWAESIGADPNNPPTDITRPIPPNNWGKYSTFNVLLDGEGTGAVFEGHATNMHVTRTAGLAGAGVTLTLTVNNTAMPAVTSTGNEVFNVALSPDIGLNILDFSWTKGTQQVEDETLRFRAIR